MHRPLRASSLPLRARSLLLGALGALGLIVADTPARADGVYNHNLGTYTDLLSGFLNIVAEGDNTSAPTFGTANNAAGGYLSIDPQLAAGHATTTMIAPAHLGAWGWVYVDFTAHAASDIAVTFIDANDNPYALGTIQASDLPAWDGRFSLAGVPASVGSGRLRFDLAAYSSTSPDAWIPPVLLGFQVTWAAQSEARVAYSAPTSAPTSGTIAYQIKLAINYVNATGLVVYAPLPTTPADPNGRPNAASFVNASDDGYYNASARTFPGVNGATFTVPGNSVVWELGTVTNGTTRRLNFALTSPRGTYNGTVYGGPGPSGGAQAFAFGSNTPAVTSNDVKTTLTSVAAPFAFKSSSGTYTINNQQRAVRGSQVTWNVVVGNYFAPPPSGTQYYPGAVAIDCPTSLLTAGPNGGPVFDGTISVSNGGHYNAGPGTQTIRGVTLQPGCIGWDIGLLDVGQSVGLSYTVTLKSQGLVDNTPLPNTVNVVSAADQHTASASHTVYLGVPETPSGIFANGLRIRGLSSISVNDDLPTIYVRYGEPVTSLLYAQNSGASALRDVAMIHRVADGTTFSSAWLPPEVGGTIYYSTAARGSDDAPAVPPGVSAVDGTFDTNTWKTALPANPATVTWVMMRVPKLASVYFPESPAVPAQVTGEVTVIIDTPTSGCPTPSPKNWASFQAFAYEAPTSDAVTVRGGLTAWVVNMEPEQVKAIVPSFEVSSASLSPGVVNGVGQVDYTLDVRNVLPGAAETDVAHDVEVVLDLPWIDVDGEDTWLPLVAIDADGGGVDYSEFPQRLTITYPAIAGNDGHVVRATFQLVAGYLPPEPLGVRASIVGQDDACGEVSRIVTASAQAVANPYLVLSKTTNLSIAAPGSSIEYAIHYSGVGPAASTYSYVVDRIPAGTSFDLAQAPPGGGKVYFSAAAALPASLADGSFEWSQAAINAYFREGVDNGNGGVEPPDDLDDPRWIAFRIDDMSLVEDSLPVGGLGTVRFTVTVDGSLDPNGQGLRNAAAIFAEGLLAAVSNDTSVVVAETPSLAVALECPGVIAAGDEVTLHLDYHNDSTTDASEALVSFQVPDGFTLVDATHTWNAASSGYIGIDVEPSTDGVNWTWDITGALGDPLRSLEGGRLTLVLEADADVPSGTLTELTIVGAAQTDGEESQSAAGCSILVENPDLYVVKGVDQPSPVGGEEITYTLAIWNLGRNSADAVVLTDTLPQGLSYVADSAFIATSGWAFAGSRNPAVSGSRLTWANLRHGTDPIGWFPAQTGPVTVTLKARLANTVPPRTTLRNRVEVSTESDEDGLWQNWSDVSVTTPRPDPWVAKSGPAYSKPGAVVTWRLQYGNQTRATALGVVVVDRVWDDDGDGVADVRYAAHSATHGESVWFHAGSLAEPQPAFSATNPAGGGWTQDPNAGVVNWIAFYSPTLAGLAGPYSVYVDFVLASPTTGLPIPDASTVDNCATVGMVPGGLEDDERTDNNKACATLRTPGNDLAAAAQCEPEGVLPGATVGDEVAVTLDVYNRGTTPIYGVGVTWTPPAGFVPLADDSASVNVTTSGGAPASLLDASTGPAGPQPLTANVAWDKVGDTWYLGVHDGGAAPLSYRRIALAPDTVAHLRITGTVAPGVGNNTTIAHAVTVATDNRYDVPIGDRLEENYGNNTGGCDFRVYLPDPFIHKTGAGIGNSGPLAAGDHVAYSIEFNNAGGTAAADTTLSDDLPPGMGYVVGSLQVPDGATVSYLDRDGAPYVPGGALGSVDWDVASFELAWDTLPAPANATSFFNSAAQFGLGSFDGTVPSGGSVRIAPERASGTWTSPSLPEGNVVEWTRIALRQTALTEGATTTVAIVDAETGEVIADNLVPDGSGAIALDDLLDPQGNRHIKVVVTLSSTGFGCDYTVDQKYELPSPVPIADQYYVYGCGARDTLIGERRDEASNNYFPVIWERDSEDWTLTELPIGDALEGEPYFELSPGSIIGEVYNGENWVATEWFQGPDGWEVQPISPDGEPWYENQYDLSSGYLTLRPQNGPQQIQLAHKVDGAWSFAELPPPAGVDNFWLNDVGHADEGVVFGSYYDSNKGSYEAVVWELGPAGAWLPTASFDAGLTNYYCTVSSFSDNGEWASVYCYDYSTGRTSYFRWQHLAFGSWIQSSIPGTMWNTWATWMANDGDTLLGYGQFDGIPYNQALRWRRAGATWTVTPLPVPSGYSASYLEGVSKDGRLAWGTAQTNPDDYASRRTVLWTRVNGEYVPTLLSPEAQTWPQSIQPFLDRGLVIGQYNSDPRQGVVWRLPSTTGAPITTYIMTSDQFDGTLEQADYIDIAEDISPGCNVLGGYAEDWAIDSSRPMVWELDELDEPFELATALPQGDHFSNDVAVQGAYWDMPYGIARDANGDRVLTVWRASDAGMKPYMLANLAPIDAGVSVAQMATMAPDGSWVAGHAFDDNETRWPVVWYYDAADDEYGEPQTLTRCTDGLCAPDFMLDIGSEEDPGGLRLLPGVILSWHRGETETETLWLPWADAPAGFVTVDEVLAEFDPSLYYDGWVGSTVDVHGQLSALVIDAYGGEQGSVVLVLEPDDGEAAGYRVTALAPPSKEQVPFSPNYVFALDIGAHDVIVGGAGDGELSIALVWTRDATGTWSAQALPGTNEGTLVSRTAGPNGWPLLLVEDSEDLKVYEADASGHYGEVELPVPEGYTEFHAFTDLWPDATRVFNQPARWGDDYEGAQSGFELGFVGGTAYDENYNAIAVLQVRSDDGWTAVPLTAPGEGGPTSGIVMTVGRSPDGARPVIFGHPWYGESMDRSEPIGWWFSADEPTAANTVRFLDLLPQGSLFQSYETTLWTSTADGNTGTVLPAYVNVPNGGPKRGRFSLAMLVPVDDGFRAIATALVDPYSRDNDLQTITRTDGRFILGYDGRGDGEGRSGAHSILWGCGLGAGNLLDSLEVVYRTDQNPRFGYELVVPDVCQDEITNSASIVTSSAEITTANNSSSVTLPIATTDLGVRLDASRGVVTAGDYIVWTAEVTNRGEHLAKNVLLTIAVPNALADGTSGFTEALGDLAPGETRTVSREDWDTNVQTADAGVAYVANARVSSSTIECLTDDNEATALAISGDLPNVYVDKLGPATAAIGVPFDYVIVFGNDGNAGATDVTLTDLLPPGLTVLGYEVPELVHGDTVFGCEVDGGALSCAYDDLLPDYLGDSSVSGPFELIVTVVADDCAAAGAILHNTATVDAALDVNFSDNSSSVATRLLPAPGKLSLAVVPGRAKVAAGEPVTWFIHYRNDGTGPVNDAVIQTSVPAGVSLVDAGGAEPIDGDLQWTLPGQLMPGDSGQVAFTGVVTTNSGTLTGSAAIALDVPSEAGACGVTAPFGAVTVTDGGLRIDKQASASVTCGGTLDWVITVTNDTGAPQAALVVSDTIGASLTYVGGSIAGPGASAASQPTLVWTLPVLAPGEVVTLGYRTTAPASNGVLASNVARVGRNGTSLATSSAVLVRGDCNAALRLDKSWDATCAQPGDTVTVHVRYRNAGTTTLTNVVVSDFVQAGFADVEVLGDGRLDEGGRVRLDLPTLAVGASGILTYTATLTAEAGAMVLNSATMVADGVDPTVSNQVQGVIVDCADTDPCTVDSCQPFVGCVNALTPTDEPELCDGIDNDCDRFVDGDDYDGSGPFPADSGLVRDQPCALQDGVCEGTMKPNSLCVGATWGPCVVATYEELTDGLYALTDETCDQIDEDCDGHLGEDFDVRSTSCGVGACVATGTIDCDEGELVTDCTPKEPESETDGICNGVDDDCDGEVADEDEEHVPLTVACGDNACAAGTGQTFCRDGELGNDCNPIWGDISDIGDDICAEVGPPASGLNVIYLVVQGDDGKDAGTVRCWQDLDALGEMECETDPPGSSVLKIYKELLCLPPAAPSTGGDK